jgi:hypothetical protein
VDRLRGLGNAIVPQVAAEILRCVMHAHSLPNVKEHATLSAGASVDHTVEVETTEGHVNRAADRGCCVSACSASSVHDAWFRYSTARLARLTPTVRLSS